MFHHRSCGTTQLVALMAAHRAAHQAVSGPEGGAEGGAGRLRQQDITRLTEALLATAPPEEAWQQEAWQQEAWQRDLPPRMVAGARN